MISFKVLCLVIHLCPGGGRENSVQPAVVSGILLWCWVVNKILFYFGHLPIILQQKQQLVGFFFRETEKVLCKVTKSQWVYELKKAKHIFKDAEISSLAE